MTERFEQCMRKSLEDMHISVTAEQLEQLEQYYELLIQKNKVMNLTAITELEEVAVKHFADSLSLVKAVPNLGELPVKIIDVGTGAGFPGIPLKIIFPKLDITLLDSLNKRVKFLNEVIGTLKLQGITAVHGRAEDYGRDKKYRENFDFCVSRAVANLAVLSEYCVPFVKIEGYFIPYKSGQIDEELKQAEKAVKTFGGKIEKKTAFTLPGTDMERSLISIKKEKATSMKYPRKAGMPSKEPIQ